MQWRSYSGFTRFNKLGTPTSGSCKHQGLSDAKETNRSSKQNSLNKKVNEQCFVMLLKLFGISFGTAEIIFAFRDML